MGFVIVEEETVEGEAFAVFLADGFEDGIHHWLKAFTALGVLDGEEEDLGFCGNGHFCGMCVFRVRVFFFRNLEYCLLVCVKSLLFVFSEDG